MTPVASISSPGKSHWPWWLALVGFAGLVYWPVLGFDFVRWDDDLNITQNPLLTAPWSWSVVGQLFGGDHAMRFEPLHWLCSRLLHDVFGFSPAGWHGFNLALHLVATVWFFEILRRLIRRFVPEEGEFQATCGAGLGAALWSLHPLRAEVVAWATASTYSLTAVWLLTSFDCYLRARDDPASSRRWLVLAWVFAVAAYGSYPVGITYGFWLLAVDRWLPLAGNQRTKPDWNRAWGVRHVCFLVPAGLALGVTLWTRFTTPGIFAEAPTIATVGILSRLTMALAALTKLLCNFFWPVDLTPNRSPLLLRGGVQEQMLALLALLALMLAWRGRQKHPGWALSVLGFALLALPCLGLTEMPTWPVDRYSYLVHLILVGGLSGLMVRWVGSIRWRQAVIAGLAGAVLLTSAWAVRRQIMTWQDSNSLFTHMELQPDFANDPRQQSHVYFLWGLSEAATNQPAHAAELFNRAQQVYLGAIHKAVARGYYVEALSLSAQLAHNFALTPIMRRERGAWLLRLDRPAEALVELQFALQAMPDDPRLKTLLMEAQR